MLQPLDGLVVLEFSEGCSGSSASLRLADFGARVIKIESTYSEPDLNRDEQVFSDNALNRNKESYVINFASEHPLRRLKKLVKQADIIIDGLSTEKRNPLGLDYQQVRELNPAIVYGKITGYGTEGPFQTIPPQDILVQAVSGLPWLNGHADQEPVPFPLEVAHLFAGAQLVQGILACLLRRRRTNLGGYVEVSLLEALIDLQFEVLSTHLNDGRLPPRRSKVNNAHAYLGAPYGIYETANGYLALAMGAIPRLGELLQCHRLLAYSDEKLWFEKRDEIKGILVSHLKTRTTKEWLAILEAADYWCAEVQGWEQLIKHEGFKTLDMILQTKGANGIKTVRSPISFNGSRFTAETGAPEKGAHNSKIEHEFKLLEEV